MTFSEMIRALRREPDRKPQFIMHEGFYTLPGFRQKYWRLVDCRTQFFHYVPLPEGWVLPR